MQCSAGAERLCSSCVPSPSLPIPHLARSWTSLTAVLAQWSPRAGFLLARVPEHKALVWAGTRQGVGRGAPPAISLQHAPITTVSGSSGSCSSLSVLPLSHQCCLVAGSHHFTWCITLVFSPTTASPTAFPANMGSKSNFIESLNHRLV